ncbi:MAG: hypothetical protein ABWY04_11050 [Arthrobacter sp.]
MNPTGQHPDMPHLDSVEADPAYDYAEDMPVDAAETEEEELLDEAERRVPLDEEDFLGDEQTVVPLDGDEFLEPDEEE